MLNAHLPQENRLVGGQLSRLSSMPCVSPPEFAQNYVEFPARGCFHSRSVTVVFWPGRAGSVVRTHARLRPAGRLMLLLLEVRQTSA